MYKREQDGISYEIICKTRIDQIMSLIQPIFYCCDPQVMRDAGIQRFNVT